MKKRLLNIALALGLVTGLFIGAIAPAGATPEFPGEPTIYFPWVPNNDTIAGIEGVTGSITVQNVEIFPVDVVVTDADGNELTSITLNPRASQTWTADQLGLPEPGSGVIAVAAWNDINDLLDNDAVYICDAFDYDTTHTTAGGIDQVDFFAPVDGIRVSQDGFVFPPDSYNWQHDGTTLFVDWSPDGPEPAEGSTYTVTVLFNCPLPSIAGLEKHTVGTAGARTTSATEMVDGYSAVPLIDLVLAGDGGAVLEGQSRWVVPIVQTNSGWNTEIVITNVSGMNNSVNATYYAAGGQGYAGPSEMILSGRTLAPGETVRVDLRDYGFPEGEVGSLWVDGTHAVVAGAFRHKVETGMMLTTVAQPRVDFGGSEEFDSTIKYGPLVFRDYNGWNTGINIANLSSNDNRVTVTYYNYAGNVVASDTIVIPSRAMEYVYTPATGNFGLADSQITAVRIAGDYPLAAAIDEVKYLGGQGEGHAMSYPAAWDTIGYAVADPNDPRNPIYLTGRYAYESLLALPLVQKGNPTTGAGDTSGINLYNPSAAPVEAWVQFLDSAGVPVAPTVGANDAEDPIVLPLGAGAGATVYTLNYSEMPAGFQGSAIVGVVNADWLDTDAVLVGVSNNVNYDVAGDGSAVYNLVSAHLWYAFFD